MLTKMSLTGIVLGAAMLLSGAGTAKADCYSNIRNKERDLYRAQSRYGAWSGQANHERNELRQAQQNCGNYRNNGWNNGWSNGWYRGNDHDRDDRWVNRNRNGNWRRDGDQNRDNRRRDRDHDGDRR